MSRDEPDIPGLLSELDRLANGTTDRLTTAVEDVDKILDLLTNTREHIAQGTPALALPSSPHPSLCHGPCTSKSNNNTTHSPTAAPDPHTASLALTRLQNPVKEGFEAINDDLRKVDRVRKDFSKVLNRRFPARPLPTDDDAMAQHPKLINRALTWHLLREGQFNVASTFIREAHQAGQLQEQEPEPALGRPSMGPPSAANGASSSSNGYAPVPPADRDTNMDGDGSESSEDMDEDFKVPGTRWHPGTVAEERDRDAARDVVNVGGGDDAPMTEVKSLESHQLQEKFSTMYSILSQLKNHNLMPAIRWAHQNTGELEARGSDLEFELCKRQYIYLIQQQRRQSSRHRIMNDDGGLSAAMDYAQSNFPRFAERHAKEIAQLASALVFRDNLQDSPYADLFDSTLTGSGFDDVASSFTREFCSLLGLSAESPLYVAATAGAISLPRLMKYVETITAARASWTTASELAFETPLPRGMVYHSIFVCPVSKEQTTDQNPPMMLPCGHVLANESLRNLVRAQHRYKCPYCPVEGALREARQIIL